mgnify:FL=1
MERRGEHKIIHIDQRPAHINMLYQPEVEVVGDISYSLQQILYRSDAKEEPEEFLKLREEMVAEYESYADDTSFPMKPQKILYDVRKFMGADDIVISDVGAHKMWIAREYNCYEPNTCIISNGFATMGIAVPGAVAAKLIYPEKKVLAISGDGGFMMNSRSMRQPQRGDTHCDSDLLRCQLWSDQMEADGSLRTQLLCGFSESRFCEICGKHACQRLPRGEGGRPAADPGGCLSAEGPLHHRLSCGLQRKYQAFGVSA